MIEYKWIKCSEKLPGKKTTSVFAFMDGKVQLVSVDYYFYRNDYRNSDITHWLPIPDKPETK